VASALRSRLVRQVVQLPARAVSTLPVQRVNSEPSLRPFFVGSAGSVTAQTAASGSATGFNDWAPGDWIRSVSGSAAGAIDDDYGRNNSGAGTATGFFNSGGSGSFVSPSSTVVWGSLCSPDSTLTMHLHFHA
jgi:hypothetical protein